MKLKLYLIVLLCAMAILSLIACSKDEIAPSRFPGNGNTNGSAQTTSLLANYWKKDGNGFYVHTFQNILKPGHGIVKIYLLKEGREIEINHFTVFMGGQLWGTYTVTDVKIIFRYNGVLPFQSLNIKVTVE